MPNRLPEHLRKNGLRWRDRRRTMRTLRDHRIRTICESARCPNRGECFAEGAATFLLLGPTCSRTCPFCAVPGGGKTSPVDRSEPKRVAETARSLDLKHVVITSVTRDDLSDGGASQFSAAVMEVKEALPSSTTEILTPDFKGNRDALKSLPWSDIDVFNHNIETVPRLYRSIRDGADYARSLGILRAAAGLVRDGAIVKSGLMVGIGEEIDEVMATLEDLKENACDVVTIGQYLSPSRDHLEVKSYISPEVFEQLGRAGEAMGFRSVQSAPFVRSSYLARNVIDDIKNWKTGNTLEEDEGENAGIS